MDRSKKSKFSNEDLARYKKEINPAPIVAKRIKIQRVNDEWLGCCPDVFHKKNTISDQHPHGKSDIHPSFTIYKLNDGTWEFKCFSCGANGNIFQFVEQVDKIPFPKAVARVLEEAGVKGWQDGSTQDEVSVPTEAEAPKEHVTFPLDQYRPTVDALERAPEGQAWLRKRGIGMDVARKFKIGFVQSASKIVPIHAWRDDGWVLFPTLSADGQTVTAVKYRSVVGKKKKQVDGKMFSGIFRAPDTSTTLYNLQAVKPGDDVWIVEGEPDTLVLAQAGLTAVGYPGASYTPSDDECELLSSAKRKFLAGDNDGSGGAAMQKLQKRIPTNTYRIQWPTGCKDANDTLLKNCGGDEARFAELLDKLKVKSLASRQRAENSKLESTRDDWRLNIVPLSAIEAQIQEWLWNHRIPMNALTNLSGDMDKGKSLVLYDIMARISKGADMADGAPNPFGGQPKKVVLMFSEGSLKTTVKPRLMVMGANMDNILTVESVSRKGETDPDKRMFSLTTDINKLRRMLKENPDVVFIGFDPITNYLGDNCNMNRSQDVRRVLTPLGELAEDCGVTVVAIIHFNKNVTMSAIHRTGGAAALVEVPRAAWCCLKDDDPENKNGGFVFVSIKNNLGKQVGGLRYHIEETFIPIQGQQASEPHLMWDGPTEKSADEILTLHNDPDLKGIAKARIWLETFFKDDLARKSADVYKAAEAVGITEDCFKKARQSLKMETKKLEWQWYMRRRQGDHQAWRIAADSQEKPDTPGSEDLIAVAF